MIGYLFRVNSNNSGIFISTFYDSDNEPITIKKSAYTQSSISRLRRELKGVNWYSSFNKHNLFSSFIDLEDYFSLNLNYIKGEKADYRDGYLVNLNYIDKALIEYCEIWSNVPKDKLYSHGDFSLDNIVFTDDATVIIDWEHFSHSLLPIGFDALNLIYEQLYILINNRKINDSVIKDVNSKLKKLHSNECLDKCFFEKPLLKLHELIYLNKDIWGNQISKLPIMKITQSQLKELDKLIYLN